MKGLLVTLVVLALLLVGADRLAARFAGAAVARELQQSQSLSSEPEVSIRGFPFLTQALRGRYDRIDVTVPQASREGVEVQDLTAHLRGARIPLRAALSRTVTEVPVEQVDADGLVTYAGLAAGADRRVTIAPAGDQLKVTGEVDVLGRTLTGTAFSTVRLDGRDLVVRAQRFDVGNGVVNDLLTSVLRDRFDFRVPVGRLPYGLRLTGATVTPEGVRVSAAGGATVLRDR